MSHKSKTILKIEGILLVILACSMIPSLCIAVSKNETSSANAFVITAFLCGVVGLLICLICLSLSNLQHQKLKGRDGFFIVALSWIVASLVGAIPFWLSGFVPGFFDAFFESSSGFSTTGASIFTDVEVLPTSLLFWRSLTHWLGGMGIILLITALFPALGIDGQIAANVETPGPTKSKLTAKFSDGAKEIYFIYVIMTLVETILLKLCGLSWFDSLIHTFGSVSTGGFSSYNDSIGHFNSIYVEITVAIFMLLAAINFNLYSTIRKNGFTIIRRDEETRFYISIVLIASVCVAFYNTIMDGLLEFGQSILNAFFQVISIITTTGYMTTDYDLWPTFSRIIIFALLFIGGCSSSTGGGIKAVRILSAFKMVRRSISLKVHPNRIAQVTLNGKEMGNDTLIRISNFIFTYIMILLIGLVLLSLNGFDFMTNLSASVSCLGNVGPGFNVVGPTMNYSVFSDFSKFVCSFLMITGRVEVYAILMLFSRHYWNSNRVR